MRLMTVRVGQTCLFITLFLLNAPAAEILSGSAGYTLTPHGQANIQGIGIVYDTTGHVIHDSFSGSAGPGGQFNGLNLTDGQIAYHEGIAVSSLGAHATASATYSGDIRWGTTSINSTPSISGMLSMRIQETAEHHGVNLGNSQLIFPSVSLNANASLTSFVSFDQPVQIRGIYGGSGQNIFSINSQSYNNSGSFNFTSSTVGFSMSVSSQNGVHSAPVILYPEQGNLALANSNGSQVNNSRGFIVWGVGSLPGETPSNPLLPNLPFVGMGGGEGGSIGTGGATGWTFGVPVTGDFGHTAPVFIDPVYAEGYDYTTEGINFASVLIPAPLDGGDGTFELLVNGQSYELLAGQTFDFTALDLNGISAFSIRGIDPDEMLDPEDPTAFVTGLTFVSQGATVVNMVAAVPEPGTWMVLVSGGLALLFRRKSWNRI
jgi:hypothetical protein